MMNLSILKKLKNKREIFRKKLPDTKLQILKITETFLINMQ